MVKEKILSTLEEIKVISDPFRLKILFIFDEEQTPLTVKQMAVKLEEVPAKVHYHVKELERIGVLEIVETKEKAGIVEKYYMPTAEMFKVEKNISGAIENKEHMQAGANIFLAMQQDFERNNRIKGNADKNRLNYGVYYLTDEERNQFEKLIEDYLSDKDQRNGAKPYGFGYALYRKFSSKEEAKDGDKDRN